VSDAVEALGQDVDEEAADELTRRQCHCLIPVAPLDPVILPLEGDVLVVDRDQPAALSRQLDGGAALLKTDDG